jgi:hypothetical protein
VTIGNDNNALLCADEEREMENIDGDTMQDFINWLSDREQDIADGVEDFGGLRAIFFSLFGRNAGEKVEPDPFW